jgi:hypothetical protein
MSSHPAAHGGALGIVVSVRSFGTHMPGIRRGIPASQLARDYGVSLNEFSESIIRLIGQECADKDDGARIHRRREICAAVSAAILAALDASTLSAEERDKLSTLINEVLAPFWKKHCASENPELSAYISTRANHYLARRVEDSRVKTAVNIVTVLLDALETPEHLRTALLDRLAPAFAHRMVGDVYRINEVRRKFGVELSTLVTVCALLQLTLSYDPVLRALHVV